MENSLYDITFELNNDVKNSGADYSKVLVQKTTSNYLFKNENINGFLEYINELLVFYIDNVKKIRVFYNIAVDKNYKKIN